MNQDKKISIQYRIQQIKILNFCVNNLANDIQVNNTLQIETSVKINIDAHKQIISITIGVIIFTNQNKENKLCSLLAAFIFHTVGINKFEFNNEKIKIPDGFLVSLVSVSYSTLRGIFFEKCANTYLSNIILPLIDPIKLLKKENIDSN